MPFARMIDDCFERLGTDAVYTPDGGAPVPVRVMPRRADSIVGFGETRLHAETTLFDVRVAEVAAPRPGDGLAVGAESFVVQGEPVRDAERLVWTLDLRPA